VKDSISGVSAHYAGMHIIELKGKAKKVLEGKK
jgi:hypothetical protein